MAPSRQSAIVRFYDPETQAKDALGRSHEQILAWSNSQLENSHNYIQMLFPLPEGSPFNYAAPIIDLETMTAFRTNSELRRQLRRSFERMLTFYGFTSSTHVWPKNEEEKAAEIQEQNTSIADKSPKSGEGTDTTVSRNAEANHASTTTTEESSSTRITVEGSTTKASSGNAEDPVSEISLQISPLGYYVGRGPNFHRASRNWAVRMNHNHLRITRILRCLRVLGLQKECDAFFAALKGVYDDATIKIGPRSLEYWTRAVERPLYIAPDDEECDWLEAWERQQQEEKVEH